VALHEAALLFGTLVAETILASAHVRAHRKAGHMDASDLIKALQNTLRGGGRPHMELGLSKQRGGDPCHPPQPRRGRRGRGAGRARPALWVSDLYGAQQGHAEDWQICLAHQLRDCAYAIEAGDTVFAPRMKALLLRAVVLARRHRTLAPSTRREYRRRLECALDAVMALALIHRDGQRLRKRYGKLRSHLFTFLDHPELPADNNGSERELGPTATYRKVTGGFRSDWGADLFAGVRSVIGTAARRG